MINILHIKNIGIIDEISINFNEGLNILTGETGAGKTLIIDALNIISGDRFSKEMIRKGEEYSFVEAQITSKDSNEENIVSREIHSNGRNICKINGRLVTVNELKEFMNKFVDIHGQNDNQNILNAKEQIEYLDKFCGSTLKDIKEEYMEYYESYLYINKELSSNYGDEKEKQRKLDLLKYQLNEIEQANLRVDEEEKLENEFKIINNSEKIYQNVNEANFQIENNALEAIDIAVRKIEKIQEYNKNYESIANTLKSTYYDLQEIGRELQEKDFTLDENKKLEISERLDLIYSLKRKYGNNIEEIIQYKEKIKEEIQQIEGLEEYIIKLNKEKSQVEIKMYNLAQKLNELRTAGANKLSRKINEELQDLEMQNAKFYVRINYNNKNKFIRSGLDIVEFYIKTNIGEDEKSLSKIASGGETSRIMLAIKTVLAKVDNCKTLIFDEIDTGISGLAADRVGEKLKLISKTHQILIVTHLANIAAKGKYNYFIYKETENNKTKTKVNLLNEQETLREIARIASGNITEISLEHAKELRNKNTKIA